MRQIKYNLGILSLLLGLAACQTHSSVMGTSAQRLIQAQTGQERTVYRASYQSSTQAESQAAFQLRLQTKQSAFQTLQSQSGLAAQAIGNVLAYRVFLVSASTSPTDMVTPFPSNATNNVFTLIPTQASALTVIFDNIPAGSYYACAAAFSNASTFTSATNIVDIDSSTEYAEGPAACSSGGGIDNTGRVEIDSNYQVTGTDSLEINLHLQKAVGATIDSSITVN